MIKYICDLCGYEDDDNELKYVSTRDFDDIEEVCADCYQKLSEKSSEVYTRYQEFVKKELGSFVETLKKP